MKQRKKIKSPQWSLGHVSWFDPQSGKGSIVGDDGTLYRIHDFSEIKNKRQRVLNEKTRVEFELANDSIHPIIKTIRTVEDQKGNRTKPIPTRKSEKESSI